MATPLLEAERKTAATDLTCDLDLTIENVQSLLDLAVQLRSPASISASCSKNRHFGRD